MRIRILYFVNLVMSYIRLFKFSFGEAEFSYAGMFIHGMLYLEGQVNCKKIADSWEEEINDQRLSEFLNHGDMDLTSLSFNRINHLLNLSSTEKDYVLFSIDPSNFKKYKRKRSQKVRWTSEGDGSFLSHSFVLSSIIKGDICIPFKKIIYEGKTGNPKSRIYQRLANKFEKFDVGNLKRIAVFDGEGCNRKTLPYFHNGKDWEGFVTKFPRTRCVIIKGERIHIRKYLERLSKQDFIKYEHGYYHYFEAEVPSLEFLSKCRFVVIMDDLKDINTQSKIRILITDIENLPINEILLIYRKRWKQETYHQIIKDRLGCRTYKFRKMKAVMRFLELGDLAYSFLEYQKIITGQKSVSEVRNKIIDDFSIEISKKLALNMPKIIAKSA